MFLKIEDYFGFLDFGESKVLLSIVSILIYERF
jgi:hypothetical protein